MAAEPCGFPAHAGCFKTRGSNFDCRVPLPPPCGCGRHLAPDFTPPVGLSCRETLSHVTDHTPPVPPPPWPVRVRRPATEGHPAHGRDPGRPRPALDLLGDDRG